MKKVFIAAFMMAAITAALSSCSSDDEPEIDNPGTETVTNGAFILTQGNYTTKIEGSLDVIDFDNNTVTADVFTTANGRSLGATPQCGTVYGNKIYLGMYESNTIEILDRATYKSLKQINLQGSTSGQQPRSMAADGGKVYISMFDGYLTRLDTATMTIDASVKVGPNPEIIAISGNNIYVPNSDGMNWQNGYGTTASIVSINPFKEVSTIEVPLNPYQFIVLGGKIYLHARGDYGANPGALYRMNTDNSFSMIAEATLVAGKDNTMYIVNAPWGGDVTYSRYNTSTGDLSPVTISNIDSPSAIAMDPVNGTLLVASYPLENGYASYVLPGYVCRYSSTGTYIDRFDIGTGTPAIFFAH